MPAVDKETVLEYCSYDLSNTIYTLNQTRPLIPGWISQKQQNVFGDVAKFVEVDSITRLLSLLENEIGIVTVFVDSTDASQLHSLELSPDCRMVVHSVVEDESFPLAELSLAGSAQVLLSTTSAEAQRHALLGYILSAKSPVFHYYQLRNSSNPQSVLDIDYSQFKEVLLETKQKSLQEIDAVLSEHGIHFNPIQYSGQSSEKFLVSFGSIDKNTAEALLQQNVGLIEIVQPLPWNKMAFIKSLPSHVKEIHLLLPGGSEWSPQYLDIISTLSSSNIRPAVNFVTQSSPFNFLLQKSLKFGLKTKVTVDPSVRALLTSIFHEKLKIYHSEVSSQVSFGALLADLQKADEFTHALGSLSHSSSTPESLKTALNIWLEGKAEDRVIGKAVREIRAYLVGTALDKTDNIFKDYSVLTGISRWLIDDGSMLELSSSLIHTFLSSKEKAKVLIIDRNPYSSSDSVEFQNRRDSGLYAMNYGGTYVASICPSFSFSQAVQAIKEAEAYPGPAVVILLAPKSSTSKPSSALEQVSACKKVIDGGLFSLYRWTPAIGDGEPKLSVDCTKPKATLTKFLEKDSNLSLVLQSSQKNDVLSGMEHNIEQLVVSKGHDSYKALFGNLEKKRLIILYGSDGGNAESLSKRIGMEAKEKGLYVKVYAADAFVTEDLTKEEYVLFVVSTAGQGEFPGNIRETWKALNTSDFDFSGVKYSVFALGDRHYWPRPEDAHYFAKAGKDLDAKLAQLNGERLTNLGIGDDRDPDGLYTGFAKWSPGFWTSLGVDAEEVATGRAAPTDDAIKAASNYLRGTIAEGLVDTSTGALAEFDTKLTKFHGIYQQDDRDIRELRARKGMEKAYSFMIRVRVPGGVATAAQYLAMDEIADKWANSTIKITTRQAFQFHGVVKNVLKRTIQDINSSLLGNNLFYQDTIAACGDVNRNVMCNPSPSGGKSVHEAVVNLAKALSKHLTPATSAYHEIWLDKKLVAGGEDYEPLYGKTYLPRKFKIAIAVPPSNDVDCLAHDLGYIAIVENGNLLGYNVTVGGGMGQTHGNKKTYPLLAKPLGYCTPEKAVLVGEKVMLVQKEHGERVNRKHARLKYTIEDHGIDWFRSEVEKKLGYKLLPSKPYKFTSNGDRYGWEKSYDSTWSYTLFIQNGRIKDTDDYKLKTGLREIAKVHKGNFDLTPNQHLIISKIAEADKPLISSLLTKYSIDNNGLSGLRLNSMACVALPTCALAMAESERYLPSLVTKIEGILEDCGLRDDSITIRMTGCPNGCARPAIAEIAFIGKAPGMYNMYLGGGFAGERLNVLFKESIGEEEIIKSLEPLIHQYSTERFENEHFGDFVIRTGIVA